VAGIQFQPGRKEDPQRLTCEWLQSDHLEANGGSASAVRFESVSMGQVTRLTVTHRDLVPGGSFLNLLASGWPMIRSSLRSLIELVTILVTGEQRTGWVDRSERADVDGSGARTHQRGEAGGGRVQGRAERRCIDGFE